MPLLVD
ncbi:uncharacterized protein FRV6_09325 [Fusarium oxysporum]|nr:uncharacterized protein FRV6_09325 [Fusarium oxysporum]